MSCKRWKKDQLVYIVMYLLVLDNGVSWDVHEGHLATF